MSNTLIQASDRLRASRAIDLAQLVSSSTFKDDRNAYIVAHKATTTPINHPKILNISDRDLNFTGPFFLLPNIGETPKVFPRQVRSPDLTLTRLSDIICLPGQIALHYPQSAIKGPPKLLVESLSNQWQRDSIHLNKIDTDTFSIRSDIHHVDFLPGKYLYLANMHSPHFGHLLVDILSMTWGYETALALGIKDLGVLVENHRDDYISAMLEACGIPRSSIFYIDHPVRCEEMLFASRSFFTQGWTTPTATETWKKVRDSLDQGSGPEKVYVSRSRTKNRVLMNELEVEDLFRRRGFFIVHPQNISVQQQVTLWANAQIIAGTAGSNMFGLAFQRRLHRSLVINSPNLLHFQEMFLQSGHECETSFYLGEASHSEIHGPWQVSLTDLEHHIDNWLNDQHYQVPSISKQKSIVRDIDFYLKLFDEKYYLSRNLDVREAVSNGLIPSGRYHYENFGFFEGRDGFEFDAIWYASKYKAVTNEISHGNFFDYRHHYVTIGFLAGCRPLRENS